MTRHMHHLIIIILHLYIQNTKTLNFKKKKRDKQIILMKWNQNPQTLAWFLLLLLFPTWLSMNRLIESLGLEGNGPDYDLVVECCKCSTNERSHPEDPLHRKRQTISVRDQTLQIRFPEKSKIGSMIFFFTNYEINELINNLRVHPNQGPCWRW